jgi:hypothetical protein
MHFSLLELLYRINEWKRAEGQLCADKNHNHKLLKPQIILAEEDIFRIHSVYIDKSAQKSPITTFIKAKKEKI